VLFFGANPAFRCNLLTFFRGALESKKGFRCKCGAFTECKKILTYEVIGARVFVWPQACFTNSAFAKFIFFSTLHRGKVAKRGGPRNLLKNWLPSLKLRELAALKQRAVLNAH
jgi:hypothetical protein